MRVPSRVVGSVRKGGEGAGVQRREERKHRYMAGAGARRMRACKVLALRGCCTCYTHRRLWANLETQATIQIDPSTPLQMDIDTDTDTNTDTDIDTDTDT